VSTKTAATDFMLESEEYLLVSKFTLFVRGRSRMAIVDASNSSHCEEELDSSICPHFQ